MSVYNRGLDTLSQFASGDFKSLLLRDSGYVFNKDHDFVSVISVGNEISASGYVRQALPNPTRTITDAEDLIRYVCDPIAFGTIATGQNITGMVIYLEVTNDADSILVFYQSFPSFDTADYSPLTIYPQAGIVAEIAEI